MSKTKKSKLLASMLCATVVAGLYASPVMAATGLTLGGGDVVAASEVTINGVTLASNKVTARYGDFATSITVGGNTLTGTTVGRVNDLFNSSAATKPIIYAGNNSVIGGVKFNNGIVSGVTSLTASGIITGKGITSNGGNLYVKDTNGTTNFTVTTAGAVTANGKLTAKGGSSITYTSGNTTATSTVGSTIVNNIVGKDAKNNNYTANSTTAYNSISDKLTVKDSNGDSVATVSRAMTSAGLADSFAGSDGKTHTITTNAKGTTFGGTGATGTTVINGGSITTGSLTVGGMEIKAGATSGTVEIGGITLKKDTATGGLAVDALDIENVTLNKNGFKLDATNAANGFAVEGASGAFSIKDVGAGSTMVFTEDKDGKDTMHLDTATGNLSTNGTISVGGVDGTAVKTIVDGETGDIAVGVTGNKTQKIHLSALTGNIVADGDIVANGTSLVNVGAGLDKATEDIATLRIDTNALSGDVATLRNDTNTLRTDITNLDGKINVIENNTTDISYDKGVTTIAGTAKFGKGYMQVGSTIIAKDGSIGAANGKFTVTPDGEVIVSGENGSTNINGNGITVGDTVITNGVITTHKADIGGVEIANGRVDGVDVSELSGSVFDNSKDITELERKTTGIDYANGVTTVGGVTSFDANGMKTSNIEAASGNVGGVAMSDGGIITDRNALSVVGGVSMVGGRLQAEQGIIGGVAIKDGHVDGVDISQLRDIVGGNVTEVGDLRQKTQEISYDEATRTTTVSGVDFANGTITAGNGNFTVSENGVVTASAVNTNIVMFEGGSIMSTGIRAIDGKFIVDAEGNVKAAGDVTSTNYSLEAVGDQMKNVEGITRENGVTDIEGVAQFGNGSVKVNGAMQVAGDKFVYSYQDEEGNLRVGSLKAIDTSIDALEGKTTDIKYADGVTEIGKGVLAVNNEGYVTINNGMLVVDGDSGYVDMGNNIHFDTRNGIITAQNVYSANYNLEDVGDQLNKLETGVGETNKNVAGITRKGEVTTIEGATSFDANGMKVGNNVTINKDGSMEVRNGDASMYFNDGNISLNNGTNSVMVGNNSITLDANGTALKMNHDGLDYADGAFTVRNDGTVYANGSMTADDFITKDGIKLSEVNDKLGDLEGSVGETNKNVAGIKREEVNGDYVTVIEDYMRISNKGVALDADKFGFTYTTSDGSIGVGNLGDLANKVNEIDDRLDVVEDKTQNINGSGETGKPGEGGNQIEVPPTTDGETGINGDATVGGDLTVGGSVTAGEGNFSEKVTVGGENGTSITGDGITVGGIVKDDEGKESGSQVTIDKDDVSVDWVDKDGNKQHASIKDNAEAIEGIYEDMGAMSNRISKVEDRIDKVGAMSAAIANLRTMGYDPTAPTEIAVGIGQYRSETGAALGLFHYPNKDFMLSLSVSTSGDEVMGGIGATWKFGRKSPEQMLAAEKEKAAKAKLAKAEAMKKAAAEAKVAEQQAKHAKMAAEKAAK